jgi:uncharacterized phage protein gp47/JayE
VAQTIPTTQELADDAVAQIDLQTEQQTPFLPKSFTRVLAKATAGVNVLLYKYASWMLLQMFVAHASMRETRVLGRTVRPLVEWGRLLGVGDPLLPTQAQLSISVIVQSTSPSPVPAGAQLVYSPTGIVYVTTTPIDVSTLGTQTITVRAASDSKGGIGAGAAGNVLPGAQLSFANPRNVARVATVLSQVVTGADEETEIAYRARVIRRAQQKPQGGAYADYAQWGEEDPGILHVYPYRGDPGQVDVYVEATEESSGSEDGIPTPAQLMLVKSLIEHDVGGRATRRPVNAAINTIPITRSSFDVLVSGLEAPTGEQSAVQAAIEEAVDEYLRTREPYITGLSVLPRQDRVTRAAVSGVVDDVASNLGSSVAQVDLMRGGESMPAYTLGNGEKAKLGAVTFI